MKSTTTKLPPSRWTPVFQDDSDSNLDTVQPPIAPQDSELLDAYSKTVTEAVDKVASAVVNIRVEHETRRGQAQGGGSGFVVAPDGFILTNSHVVHGARKLDVTLADSRTFVAQLIG